MHSSGAWLVYTVLPLSAEVGLACKTSICIMEEMRRGRQADWDWRVDARFDPPRNQMSDLDLASLFAGIQHSCW